jgi:RNA polymerase sigma-70 factor, ECF subfamily
LALSDLDLADAVLKARQFDIAALGQIYDHYYPQIYRYVIFRLGDEQASREIIAQVFGRFLETLKKQRKSTDMLHAWLLEEARQLVEDHLPQAARNPIQRLEGNQSPPLGDHESLDGDMIWLRNLVCKSLQLLIPEQQHVLAIRFSEPCSPDETARIMGININDVKTIQFEALLSLRRLLEQEA